MEKKRDFDIGRGSMSSKSMKSLARTVMCTMLFVSFAFVANAFGQVRCSLNVKEASLKEVFQELGNLTDYRFVYSNNEIEAVSDVTVNMQNCELRDILSACLKGTGLGFRIEGRNVIVSPKLQLEEDEEKENVTVRGWVRDVNKNPLPGVTIRVKGTTVGFVTDMDGKFDIDLPQRDSLELIFSFIGYKSQSIKVKKNMETLDVIMKEDVQNIDEVVVTGIFNKPKESFTGAVTSVSKEELKAKYSRNLLQTLSNIDPSFRIIENNDAGSNPNVLPEIQLRGASTLSSVEDLQNANRATLNYPLFMLDGFEVDLERVMDLNDSEIENITILKDASATSLYGSRGANGVVVITTIRPSAGKLRVSYNGQVKLEIPDLSSYNLATAAEKLELEETAYMQYTPPRPKTIFMS